ncbi:MAG: hypothetical protein V9F00_03415 [Nocardioides sp.]
MRDGVAAIREAVEINVAASLGMLTQESGRRATSTMGIHRYNHNLEAARSYFDKVVTTHSWEERWETCQMVREPPAWNCAAAALVGMGESHRAARRTRRTTSAELEPARGAPQLPQPAPRHPLRRPRAGG